MFCLIWTLGAAVSLLLVWTIDRAERLILIELLWAEGRSFMLLQRINAGGNSVGQGSFYPALRSLEDRGLIEVVRSEPDLVRGHGVRSVYGLTSAGKVIAEMWRTEAR